MKLLKIKYRDEISIERFIAMAEPLYREYYAQFVDYDDAKRVIMLFEPEVVKKEIKEKRYSYYIIQKDFINVGILALENQGEILRIANISILKKYRKKGYAKEAIEKLCDFAREEGYKKLKICIEISNKKLPVIFQKLGFSKIKKIARYTGLSQFIYEDLYYMELD